MNTILIIEIILFAILMPVCVIGIVKVENQRYQKVMQPVALAILGLMYALTVLAVILMVINT